MLLSISQSFKIVSILHKGGDVIMVQVELSQHIKPKFPYLDILVLATTLEKLERNFLWWFDYLHINVALTLRTRNFRGFVITDKE